MPLKTQHLLASTFIIFILFGSTITIPGKNSENIEFPTDNTCQLILKSAFDIVLNSNGLISDLILLVPFSSQNFSRACRTCCENYLLQQSQFDSFNAQAPVQQYPLISIFSCDNNSQESPNWESPAGKVLIINFCTVMASEAFNTLPTARNYLHLFIIFDRPCENFILESDPELIKFKLSHFFTGVLQTKKDGLPLAEETSIDVYEILRPTQSGQLLITKRFTQSLGLKNLIRSTESTIPTNPPFLSEASRSNFQKHEFRVGAVMDESYAYDTDVREIMVMPTNSSQNSTNCDDIRYEYELRDSFAVEILRVLETSMNFTTIPKATDSWGHMHPNNKSWSGMVWQLLQNEVDLAISSTASRSIRTAVVDFNLRTSEIKLSAFFRMPKSSASNTNGILQPFSREFWFLLLLWILIAGLTLNVFRWFYLSYHMSNSKSTANNNISSGIVSDCNSYNGQLWNGVDNFQWVLGSLCLQSYYNLPPFASYRVIIGIGYLLSVIIYAAYAGTLISFLSVVVEPIKNLEQLLGNSKFIFYVVDNPLPLLFLSESQNQISKSIYNRRKTVPAYEHMSEVVQQLNRGAFVFLVDHMNAYETLETFFTIQDACEIKEFEIPHATQKQSSMINKNATAKRIIDYHILRMLEHGLIVKWRQKYLQAKPNCDTLGSSNQFEGVNIERLGLVFEMLGFGLCLALGFLLAEFYWRGTRQRKRRRRLLITLD